MFLQINLDVPKIASTIREISSDAVLEKIKDICQKVKQEVKQ